MRARNSSSHPSASAEPSSCRSSITSTTGSSSESRPGSSRSSTASPSLARVNPLDQLLFVDRAGQRVDQREPEALCIALAGLEPNPGDPLAEAPRLDPRAQQHRLAAPGGAADEHHPAGRGRREPLEQRLAADHPVSCGQALWPGLTHWGWSFGGLARGEHEPLMPISSPHADGPQAAIHRDQIVHPTAVPHPW